MSDTKQSDTPTDRMALADEQIEAAAAFHGEPGYEWVFRAGVRWAVDALAASPLQAAGTLTDERITELWNAEVKRCPWGADVHAFARAIESAVRQAAGAAEPAPPAMDPDRDDVFAGPQPAPAGKVTKPYRLSCEEAVIAIRWAMDAMKVEGDKRAGLVGHFCNTWSKTVAAAEPEHDTESEQRWPNAETPAPAGDWTSAEDVRRNVRALDVALNGESGAAQQAALCDIVSQVEGEARRRGHPLLAVPAGDAGALADAVREFLERYDRGTRVLGPFVTAMRTALAQGEPK